MFKTVQQLFVNELKIREWGLGWKFLKYFWREKNRKKHHARHWNESRQTKRKIHSNVFFYPCPLTQLTWMLIYGWYFFVRNANLWLSMKVWKSTDFFEAIAIAKCVRLLKIWCYDFSDFLLCVQTWHYPFCCAESKKWTVHRIKKNVSGFCMVLLNLSTKNHAKSTVKTRKMSKLDGRQKRAV